MESHMFYETKYCPFCKSSENHKTIVFSNGVRINYCTGCACRELISDQLPLFPPTQSLN